jgi:FMN phosphatase YigB (HAD superfamily)
VTEVGAAAAAAASVSSGVGPRLEPAPAGLQAVCFDWGGTLMADDGPADRPMVDWPRVTVLAGAAELLRGLHGRWRICLATNAAQSSRAQIEAALQRAGLRPWIDEIFCARELGLRKEEPAFWSTVAERLGLRPEQIAMLGDSPEGDVRVPQRCGVAALWFNAGGLQTLTPEKEPLPMVTRLEDFGRWLTGGN